MRRIVFLKSQIALPATGADRSMYERLKILKQQYDWAPEVFCVAPAGDRAGIIEVAGKLGMTAHSDKIGLRLEWQGIPVTAWLRPESAPGKERSNPHISQVFSEHLAKNPPRLVLANMRDISAFHFAVEQQHCPAVFFMTEDEYPRRPELEAQSAGSLIRDFEAARNVVVATRFLQQSLKTSWGIEAQVFLNAIDLTRCISNEARERNFITSLHPYGHKGVDLFLAIADALPTRRFLLMGGVGAEYRARKAEILKRANLTMPPFQPDVSSVYAASRIVLVPSLWQEAFSRVVVEALAAGVPVVASDIGGIREAGGDAAIYLPVVPVERGKPPPPQNPAPWVETVKKFDDADFYAAAVQAAAKRTAQYQSDLKVSMERMHGWLSSLCR